MKMKLIKYLLISGLLLSIANKTFAADTFQEGKAAFYKRDYYTAYSDFQKLLSGDNSNVIYRYYLAQTLIYTGHLEEAKEEYLKIIAQDPLSTAANYSRVGLVKIEKFINNSKNNKENFTAQYGIMAGLEDNYIYNALVNGDVVRWDVKKMPLKLYISNSTTNNANIVKKAFYSWFSKLGKPFSYTIVKSENNADITITFVNGISKTNNAEAQGFIGGLTSPKIVNNKLVSVQILLCTNRPNGMPLSDLELYNIILHETGHAIGIYGHSDNPDDVMYATNAQRKVSELSRRDINTAKLLYKLDSDITNSDKVNSYSSKNSNILGGTDKRHKKKLTEALNYVKQVPYEPLSWTTLANEYLNEGNSIQAIINFKKALSINSNYTPALIGLTKAYFNTNNNYQASQTLKKLVQQDPTNISYSHDLALVYLKMNNKQEASNTITSLINKNPKAAEDKSIKTLLNNINNS